MSPRRRTWDEEEAGSPVKTGIAMALATLLGVALTFIATGLQAGSLRAYQRQADALERIADTMRPDCSIEPTRTPVLIQDTFY